MRRLIRGLHLGEFLWFGLDLGYIMVCDVTFVYVRLHLTRVKNPVNKTRFNSSAHSYQTIVGTTVKLALFFVFN